jgi:hypothetical protein
MRLLRALKNTLDFKRIWRQIHSPDKYRPEKHYMRGPGPKCQEKRVSPGHMATAK